MTRPADPAPALAGVLPDVTGLDADTAGDALGQVKRIRSYLDAYEARVTAHVRRLHARGESAPAADLHTRRGGVSAKDARTKERRADILERAPSLADALANGTATAGHADALADAAARVDDQTRRDLLELEADLAADAARQTPDEFARTCRDLIRQLEHDQGIERDRRQRRDTRVSTRIDRNGMYVLDARLHPELGNIVFNAIHAETAALVAAGGDRTVDRARVAADALGNLVTRGHQASRPAEAEIRLHIDVATLLTGPHPDTVCEYDDGTPIPPATVRRLVCNGRIVPIIVDANGVVLDAGREQRLANRHQRRALRAMYPTCAFPGCDTTFERCEVHHLHPYELGGSTDLDNLLPLCSRHHHVIHEPGWSLHLDPGRTLTVRRPGGRVHAVEPLRPPGCRREPATTDGQRSESPPPGRPPDPPTEHRTEQLPLIA